MEYDKKAFIEPMVTNTPAPTKTPKPTNTPAPERTSKPTGDSDKKIPPEYYNDFAAIYIMTMKMVAYNPDSLEVHSIDIMKYKGYQYLVVDFSCENNVNSYVRDVYSFRFEEMSILSSDEDLKAINLYNEHKSEFILVKSLDVDTVMQIANN